MNAYYQELKSFIENVSESNNQLPVVLIGHSYGTLHIWHLLAANPSPIGIDQAWKDKYIRSSVMIGFPTSGSVAVVVAEVQGTKMFPFCPNFFIYKISIYL